MKLPRVIKQCLLCVLLLLTISISTHAFSYVNKSLAKTVDEGMKANLSLIKDAQGTITITKDNIEPENDLVNRQIKYKWVLKGKRIKADQQLSMLDVNQNRREFIQKWYLDENIYAHGTDTTLIIEKADPLLFSYTYPLGEGVTFHPYDLYGLLDKLKSLKANVSLKIETQNNKKYYVLERTISKNLMRFYIDPDKGFTIVKEIVFWKNQQNPNCIRDVMMTSYEIPGSSAKVWFPKTLIETNYDLAGINILNKSVYEYTDIRFNQNLSDHDINITMPAGSSVWDVHMDNSNSSNILAEPATIEDIAAGKFKAKENPIMSVTGSGCCTRY
jgi:outer membrane lipoprotein-sorting protein